MPALTRGALAALLLEHDLPDPAIAAGVLMDADFDQPVKMRTAPDPGLCQNLVRGNWVKAATLALSTDDPALLAKLARHSSVQVRRAAASNSNLPDDSRRLLEDQALQRDDTELFREVVLGADWTYLAHLAGDSERWARSQSYWRDRRLLGRFARLAVEATVEDIERIAATGAGRWLPVMAAVNDRVDRLALTGDSRLGTEKALLEQLLQQSPLIDHVAVRALLQLDSLQPGVTQRLSLTAPIDAGLDAESRAYLIETSSEYALACFASDPDPTMLDTIAQRWGVRVAARALVRAEASPHLVDALVALVRRAGKEASDACDYYVAAFGSALTHFDEVLTSASNSTIRRWSQGVFGPVELSDAVALVERDPDMLVVIMNSSRNPAVTHDLVDWVTEHGDERTFHLLVRQVVATNMSVEQALAILRRIHATGADTTVNFHALSQDPHRQFLVNAGLDKATMLSWIRVGSSLDLTISFLAGELGLHPQPEDVAELLEHPGAAFEGRPVQWMLLRRFDGPLAEIDVRLLDQLVDAAGGSIIEAMTDGGAVVRQRFGKYLADRISRTGNATDAWRGAFDLLVRSTMTVGDTLRAAHRLRRRSPSNAGGGVTPTEPIE